MMSLQQESIKVIETNKFKNVLQQKTNPAVQCGIIKYFVFFIVFQIFITSVNSTQMIIVQKLQEADKQIIHLSKEISTLFQSQITLKGQQYQCYIISPSQFLKSRQQKVHNLNLKISYQPQKNQIVKVNVAQSKKIVDYYQNYDYDKILDLLHGLCVHHQTKEFIYEYCHKEKARQYDSIQTYINQAKQALQDISLGVFNYQKQIQKSKAQSDSYLSQKSKTFQLKYDQNGQISVLMDKLVQSGLLTSNQANQLNQNIKQLEDSIKKQLGTAKNQNSNIKKPQVQVNTLPSPSQIYDQKNILTVQYADHPQFQLQHEKKMIKLTTPLFSTNQYYTTYAFTYVVECQYDQQVDSQHLNNQNKILQTRKVYNIVRAVSPYQLVFTDQNYQCTRVTQVNFTKFINQYGSPFSMQQVRIFQNYIYGNLQNHCTNNWAWNKQQNSKKVVPEMNDYLQQGTVLLIEIFFNKTKQVKHQLVTIQQMLSPRLAYLDQNLGEKLGQNKSAFLDEQKQSFQKQVFVNNCKIISKKRINYKSKTANNLIIGKSIIKVHQKQNSVENKEGSQMLCLCQFNKYSKQFLEMDITLGNKLLTAQNRQPNDQKAQKYSYYHYYLKPTVKTTGNINEMNQMCSNFDCYNYKKQNQEKVNKKATEKEAKLIQTIILNPKNNKIQSTQVDLTDNSILMINILKAGMIKIITKSIDNPQQIYTYIITQKSILRVFTYPNNTKEIIQQNPFYQNSTLILKILRSWLSNTVYLHKGGIWRYGDRILFPRMKFQGEQIQTIQLVAGIAYIKKIDTRKLKNQKSLKISMYRQLLENFYQVKKYPIYQKQSNTKIELQQQALNEEMKRIREINENKNVQNQQKSYYKPLNQSVSLKYQYFHGDFCAAPIGKNRRTDVLLKCGEAWFKFIDVKQPSPCVYQFNIQTRLLCRQDYKKTVQRIESIMPNKQSKLSLKRSTVCFEKRSSFDETNFIYDIQTKNIYYDQ